MLITYDIALMPANTDKKKKGMKEKVHIISSANNICLKLSGMKFHTVTNTGVDEQLGENTYTWEGG
jgi:hypothetical protein